MNKENLEFPAVFKKIRLDRKLSQESLAKVLEISPSYVRRIETDNVIPSVKKLIDWFHKLQLTDKEREELLFIHLKDFMSERGYPDTFKSKITFKNF
jgi:transcriptional regulator with XRE-family HTH domain